MKKVLLLSILVTTISYSQSDGPNLSFGIGIGPNFSFFNTPISELGNNESLGYSSHFRFSGHINFSVFYKLNDYFRLESGLRYIGKGTEYRREDDSVVIFSDNGGVDNGYQKTRFRLDYLELPVKANINLKKVFKSPNSEHMPVYLNLGLSGGINLKSDIRTNSYTPRSSSGGGLVEVRESFRTSDFDFTNSFVLNSIVGVNYVFQENSTNKLWASLEYNQSLMDVYDEESIDSTYNYKTKNGSISLAFGIEFN